MVTGAWDSRFALQTRTRANGIGADFEQHGEGKLEFVRVVRAVFIGSENPAQIFRASGS